MSDRGTSFNNAIAAHEYLAGTRERAMLYIKDVGCVEHDGVVSGNGGASGGRLSMESMCGGKSQDEDERSSGAQAQGSEHAPNTSTLAGWESARREALSAQYGKAWEASFPSECVPLTSLQKSLLYTAFDEMLHSFYGLGVDDGSSNSFKYCCHTAAQVWVP
jgi:hypothetical protein